MAEGRDNNGAGLREPGLLRVCDSTRIRGVGGCDAEFAAVDVADASGGRPMHASRRDSVDSLDELEGNEGTDDGGGEGDEGGSTDSNSGGIWGYSMSSTRDGLFRRTARAPCWGGRQDTEAAVSEGAPNFLSSVVDPHPLHDLERLLQRGHGADQLRQKGIEQAEVTWDGERARTATRSDTGAALQGRANGPIEKLGTQDLIRRAAAQHLLAATILTETSHSLSPTSCAAAVKFDASAGPPTACTSSLNSADVRFRVGNHAIRSEPRDGASAQRDASRPLQTKTLSIEPGRRFENEERAAGMAYLPDIPEEQLSLMSESTPVHSPAQGGDEVSAGASDSWTATQAAALRGSSVTTGEAVDFAVSHARQEQSTATCPSPTSPSKQASVRRCASPADLGRHCVLNTLGCTPTNARAAACGGVEEDRGWRKEQKTDGHGGVQVQSGPRARETDSMSSSSSSPSGAALAALDGPSHCASTAAMDGTSSRQQLLAEAGSQIERAASLAAIRRKLRGERFWRENSDRQLEAGDTSTYPTGRRGSHRGGLEIEHSACSASTHAVQMTPVESEECSAHQMMRTNGIRAAFVGAEEAADSTPALNFGRGGTAGGGARGSVRVSSSIADPQDTVSSEEQGCEASHQGGHATCCPLVGSRDEGSRRVGRKGVGRKGAGGGEEAVADVERSRDNCAGGPAMGAGDCLDAESPDAVDLEAMQRYHLRQLMLIEQQVGRRACRQRDTDTKCPPMCARLDQISPRKSPPCKHHPARRVRGPLGDTPQRHRRDQEEDNESTSSGQEEEGQEQEQYVQAQDEVRSNALRHSLAAGEEACAEALLAHTPLYSRAPAGSTAAPLAAQIAKLAIPRYCDLNASSSPSSARDFWSSASSSVTEHEEPSGAGSDIAMSSTGGPSAVIAGDPATEEQATKERGDGAGGANRAYPLASVPLATTLPTRLINIERVGSENVLQKSLTGSLGLVAGAGGLGHLVRSRMAMLAVDDEKEETEQVRSMVAGLLDRSHAARQKLGSLPISSANAAYSSCWLAGVEGASDRSGERQECGERRAIATAAWVLGTEHGDQEAVLGGHLNREPMDLSVCSSGVISARELLSLGHQDARIGHCSEESSKTRDNVGVAVGGQEVTRFYGDARILQAKGCAQSTVLGLAPAARGRVEDTHADGREEATDEENKHCRSNPGHGQLCGLEEYVCENRQESWVSAPETWKATTDMQVHTSEAPSAARVCRQTKTNRDVLAVIREKANYVGNSQSSGDHRSSKTRLNGQDDLTWDMLRGWMPPTPYVNKAKEEYRNRHPGKRFQQPNVEDEGWGGTEREAGECRQRMGVQQTESWKKEMCGAIESSFLRAQAVMASAGLLPR